METNIIYNEDCLETMKRLPDKSIDLILTSPPYNMRKRVSNGIYTNREDTEHFSKKYKYFPDNLNIEDYYNFHKNALNEMIRVSKLIIWNIQIVTGSKEAIFKLIGDFNKKIKDIIIWDKGWGQPAMNSGCINRATELLFILESGSVAGRSISYTNFKRGTMEDIWRIKREKQISAHSAAFPLELAMKAILNFSKERNIIYDPFTGTGQTQIAAIKLGRKWIGSEISLEYCEIANKRIKEELSQTKFNFSM